MQQVEPYTPDEAEIFYNAFKDAITTRDSTDCYRMTRFILRNKEKFTDGCKGDMIYISDFWIEKFKGDGSLDNKNYVKLLRRFVRELNFPDE